MAFFNTRTPSSARRSGDRPCTACPPDIRRRSIHTHLCGRYTYAGSIVPDPLLFGLSPSLR